MSIKTGIQWCDSSWNIQMGCEGCELVKGNKDDSIIRCYAKVMTDRYQGRKGWPEAFEKPKIFYDRIPKMIAWPDLTGTDRPDKPWLNGLPRIVFLNDMGDTFSSGMPKDWFVEVRNEILHSPHQYLVLTKWPQRFAEFTEHHILPTNIWAGTSVDDTKTLFRLNNLRKVKAKIRFVSIEPLWEDIADDINLEGIHWVIIGGESGPKAKPCEIAWILKLVYRCAAAGIPVFVKQLGSWIAKRGYKDGHGGDWTEWPDVALGGWGLKTRAMPRCG